MTRFYPALILALAASTPALAQEMTTETRVGYGDLNLRSETGVKTLKYRVARAIDKACGVERGSIIADNIATKRCLVAKQAQVAPQVSDALAASPRSADNLRLIRPEAGDRSFDRPPASVRSTSKSC